VCVCLLPTAVPITKLFAFITKLFAGPGEGYSGLEDTVMCQTHSGVDRDSESPDQDFQKCVLSVYFSRSPSVCVECLIGKSLECLFLRTPSRAPYRTACATVTSLAA